MKQLSLKNHSRNIIKESSVPKSQIQAGSIIRFRYTGKVVHDKSPLVLVLNPRWKKHLHGININYLSDAHVNDLSKLVRETLTSKLLTKIGVKADIGDPEKFYHSRLKQFLKKSGTSVYRTYNLTEIKNTRVLDYRFEDKA